MSIRSVILLFLLLSVPSFAQYNSHLDSLLFQGNIEELEGALDTCRVSTASLYSRIIWEIKGNSSLNNSSFLMKALSNKNFYAEKYAGRLASITIEKVDSLVGRNEYEEAVKYLYIASFLKREFIDGLNLDSNFELARLQYGQREFGKSLKLCESMEKTFDDNPNIRQSFKDSVKTFSRKVREKFLTDEAEKKVWLSDKKNDYKLSFSAGANMIYFPSGSKNDFVYNINKFMTAKMPAALKSSPGIGFNLAAGYRVLDYLSLNLSMFSGIIKCTEFELTSTVAKTDLKITTTDIILSARYYLRGSIGFRPYLDLGYGYNTFTRSSFSFLFTNTFKNTDKVEVDENRISTTFLSAAFGMDYIPASDSRVIYNFGLSYGKPSKIDYLFKGYKLSLGFNVGILF